MPIKMATNVPFCYASSDDIGLEPANYGLDRIPDKRLTVTLGLIQHLVVSGRDPVTNCSGIQAIQWINRKSP
jgi:hypothetical protein